VFSVSSRAGREAMLISFGHHLPPDLLAL
jgi:hypothetical protein